jgi:hypothetical protein
VFSLLVAGGRFVGEMGGEGNVAILRRGLRDELTGRGYAMPAEDPQWYASVAAFDEVYTEAGFTEIEAELIDRPTPLPSGISGWVKTFRTGLMDVAGVPAEEREDVAEAVEARLAGELRHADGGYYADYVRLRFRMRKPDA